jgi:hypothetical protein
VPQSRSAYAAFCSIHPASRLNEKSSKPLLSVPDAATRPVRGPPGPHFACRPKIAALRHSCAALFFLLAFLHRVRRLASAIGAIRRISHHNFRKLKMWPVTTLLVIGAVTRAISQAPLFHAHSGYEADHYHRHSQMPENTEGIFYTNNNPLLKLPEFHPVPIIETEGQNRSYETTCKSSESDLRVLQGDYYCHSRCNSGTLNA